MKFDNLPAPFPGQKVWGARTDVASYVIVEDDGQFTASVRPLIGDIEHIIPYDDRVSTFEEAKAACMRKAGR